MEAPYCDVIGCERPADWIRLADEGAYISDYLCHQCRQRLWRVRPAEADRYLALSRLNDAARDELKPEKGWRVAVCL